ncbi:hypothetical protein ACFL6S_37720, partial [Candidatus Poribacteria bacterium]
LQWEDWQREQVPAARGLGGFLAIVAHLMLTEMAQKSLVWRDFFPQCWHFFILLFKDPLRCISLVLWFISPVYILWNRKYSPHLPYKWSESPGMSSDRDVKLQRPPFVGVSRRLYTFLKWIWTGEWDDHGSAP